MQNAALLVTAISSLIAALGGVLIGMLSLRHGSRRERQDAAEGAAERLMRPAAVDQDLIEKALEEYFRDHPHAREADTE